MVLAQAIIQDQLVTGIVKFNIAGTQDGQILDLNLRDLAPDGGTDDLTYTFRYFQSLEQELILPVGFEPDWVNVEIWPREPEGERISQSFRWMSIAT